MKKSNLTPLDEWCIKARTMKTTYAELQKEETVKKIKVKKYKDLCNF